MLTFNAKISLRIIENSSIIDEFLREVSIGIASIYPLNSVDTTYKFVKNYGVLPEDFLRINRHLTKMGYECNPRKNMC